MEYVAVFSGASTVPRIRLLDESDNLETVIRQAKLAAAELSEKYWHCAIWANNGDEFISEFTFKREMNWS